MKKRQKVNRRSGPMQNKVIILFALVCLIVQFRPNFADARNFKMAGASYNYCRNLVNGILRAGADFPTGGCTVVTVSCPACDLSYHVTVNSNTLGGLSQNINSLTSRDAAAGRISSEGAVGALPDYNALQSSQASEGKTVSKSEFTSTQRPADSLGKPSSNGKSAGSKIAGAVAPSAGGLGNSGGNSKGGSSQTDSASTEAELKGASYSSGGAAGSDKSGRGTASNYLTGNGNSQVAFGANGSTDVSPMKGADPENYFSLIDPLDSIFKIVHRRISADTAPWFSGLP